MDGYEEEVTLEFEKYPQTESYEIKRAVSYFIDLILSFSAVFVVFLIADVKLDEPMTWVWVVIATGALNFLMKVLLESMLSVTIGKGLLGLRVIDAYGPVTAGEALARNLSGIVPLLPLLDYFLGQGSALDKRQKMSDSMTGTLVIEDIPPEPEEPRPRPRPIITEAPKPREKVKLDYRKVRHGNCPRCGAPYRVLDEGDSTFNGLWNYRCTWCNHLITEEAERHGRRR